MVKVKIRGKEFPLCLTVAALDPINKRCGGIDNLISFIIPQANKTSDDQPKIDAAKSAGNAAWLLGLLIQEGEENRLMEARFSGEITERMTVPGPEDISHLLRPGEMHQYLTPLMQAISESMVKDIKADDSKNADQAGKV